MANLCRHLLQQRRFVIYCRVFPQMRYILRSFYPLFPVPTDVSHEVNLDISHSDGLRMLDADNTYAPDVLIVPSKLREFSKVNISISRLSSLNFSDAQIVHSTRAINSSYINKMKYAKLHVTSGEMPGKDRVGVTLSKLEA